MKREAGRERRGGRGEEMIEVLILSFQADFVQHMYQHEHQLALVF